MSRRLLLVAAAVWLSSCGDDRIEDDYGRTSEPAEHTCESTCSRMAECVVYLCNTDTDSDFYTDLRGELQLDCELNCDEDTLDNSVAEDPDAFACMYEQSCRDVFDYDDCGVGANYVCN